MVENYMKTTIMTTTLFLTNITTNSYYICTCLKSKSYDRLTNQIALEIIFNEGSSTAWEILRNSPVICITHLDDQSLTLDDIKADVTMQDPVSGVIS